MTMPSNSDRTTSRAETRHARIESVPDGAAYTEIWEHLSEERTDREETAEAGEAEERS